jgi:hypothetical protein
MYRHGEQTIRDHEFRAQAIISADASEHIRRLRAVEDLRTHSAAVDEGAAQRGRDSSLRFVGSVEARRLREEAVNHPGELHHFGLHRGRGEALGIEQPFIVQWIVARDHDEGRRKPDHGLRSQGRDARVVRVGAVG